MAFNKKTWVNRVVQYPLRRLLTIIRPDEGTGTEVVDIQRDEGEITTEGDAFSAANMNDLEQRIADGFNSIQGFDGNNIAPIEDEETASQAYAKGEQMLFNNTLYTAKSAIAQGDTLNAESGGNIETSDDVVTQLTTPFYGSCTTSSATTAKTVTVGKEFVLKEGATVKVKFSNKNTASTPTLNVNSTGAKYIYSHSTKKPNTWWGPEDIVEFVYNGSSWIMQPSQGEVASKNNLTNIQLITSNTTGSTINNGTFFYINGVLVRAIADIANNATLIENTNYEVVTVGGLNALNAALNKLPTVIETGTFSKALSFNAGWNLLTTINFSKTFSSTPKVFITSTCADNLYAWRVSDVTTTSFKIYIYQPAANSFTFTGNWMAVL